MLSPYRVLDLTDERGQLAGLVLAQLGAEVIAVEHSTGAPRPLTGEAYQRGKRSVRTTPEQLAALVRTCDVVLHCGDPGIDLAAVRAEHPLLITVSITAFGDTGPKADWLASDLVVSAASGQMMLNGDADRAPVRITAPQAFHHAALEAAIGAVIALHARAELGIGQHLSVSAQQSLLQATQCAMLAAGIGAPDIERHAGGMRLGPYNVRLVYPALDGHVGITYLFGEMIGRFTARLMHWVWEEGYCSEAIRDLDYPAFFELFRTGKLPPESLREATDAVAALTATRTKAELFAIARERRLLIAPVADANDILASEHFAARGYWDELDVDGRRVRTPGPWAHTTGPALRPLPRAAAVGAHDHELAQLTSRPTPAPTRASAGSATATTAATPRRRALEGVIVLDFTWVIAGPMATRLLADHGATVIRVESERRLDAIRGANPYLPGKGGIEDTALWHSISAGKRSVQLDLSTAAGRAVARDLARHADVVVEAFAPGYIAQIGLDYDTIRTDNPGVIMASSALMGQVGPLADFAGFGNLAASIAGFTGLTGWPDRAPAGPYTAYTDYVSPRFLALAIAAALDHRRRTGEGQCIDLSQAEAAIHLLAPSLLDAQLTGTVLTRLGNADPYAAPHGVYPTLGDDCWIAIACTADAHWTALATWLGCDDLAHLALPDRRRHEATLDALISARTSLADGDALQHELQGHGVPAHRVQRSAQLQTDPQLVHREHWRRVPHAVHGEVLVEGPHVRWSVTDPWPAWGGQTMGESTMWALETVLGYGEERITQLVVDDVLR